MKESLPCDILTQEYCDKCTGRPTFLHCHLCEECKYVMECGCSNPNLELNVVCQYEIAIGIPTREEFKKAYADAKREMQKKLQEKKE